MRIRSSDGFEKPYMEWMTAETKYRQLDEENQLKRRTIADAIEVLAKKSTFAGGARATLKVFPLFRLSGRVIWSVSVHFYETDNFLTIVSLPPATALTAIEDAALAKRKFPIDRFDGATVDKTARVILTDGTLLRAVEVVPTALPYDPTDLDWRIIFGLIRLQNAEASCLPFWRDRVPAEIRSELPHYLRFLDCQAVAQLEAPPLKVLQHHLLRENPSLKLSRQKIADTLEVFGVRPVKPRPRRRAASVSSSLDLHRS